MFDFIKNTKENKEESLITKIASLLIHIAKADENYTEKEKQIISKTILELGAKKDEVNEIIKIAEKNENDANQILDFTKTIKNMDEEGKEKIIEALWTVVYSDGSSDMYEESLMRRLSGLLYLDKKKVGDLKEKIKKSSKK
tara:strand:- start:324 stop:746 length:423 start_codon:yes stop_codon:yes gene_type:complete